MIEERACRIERTDRMLDQSQMRYDMLTNDQLLKLASKRTHRPAIRNATATDELYELKLARAYLNHDIESREGNHLDSMRLMMELNRRIRVIDIRDRIKAMAERHI